MLGYVDSGRLDIDTLGIDSLGFYYHYFFSKAAAKGINFLYLFGQELEFHPFLLNANNTAEVPSQGVCSLL